MTETGVEEAKAAAQGAVAAADAAAGPVPPKGTLSQRNAKFALTVAITAAIILLVILLPSSGSAAHYTDVREITASPAAYNGQTVAVVGGVKPGSVSIGGAQFAFDLTDYSEESTSVRVVYAGGMDANFGDGKKVLVEGRVVVEEGVAKLLATKISIGCPTDYRGSDVQQ